MFRITFVLSVLCLYFVRFFFFILATSIFIRVEKFNISEDFIQNSKIIFATTQLLIITQFFDGNLQISVFSYICIFQLLFEKYVGILVCGLFSNLPTKFVVYDHKVRHVFGGKSRIFHLLCFNAVNAEFFMDLFLSLLENNEYLWFLP